MKQKWSSMGVYCVLLGFCAISHANEKTSPGIGLLEFLGEWQDEDGELIDPLLLDEAILADTNIREILKQPTSAVPGDTQ